MKVIIEFLQDINQVILELIPIVAFCIVLISIYKLLKK